MKFTDEHKRKLSLARIGKTPWNKGKTGYKIHSEDSRKRLSKQFKKLFRTEEWRRNISKTKIGEKNPNQKGGVSKENELIRKGLEYKLWRESVFKRDNYTCQGCGITNVKLNADHIEPFAISKELRFNINNGRTLCVPCHRKTDTYGWNVKYLK